MYRQKWNRERVVEENVEVYPDMYLEKADSFLDVLALIKSANLIDGVAFQPLDHLMMCKVDSGREKDLADVVLIEKHLAK